MANRTTLDGFTGGDVHIIFSRQLGLCMVPSPDRISGSYFLGMSPLGVRSTLSQQLIQQSIMDCTVVSSQREVCVQILPARKIVCFW